MLEGNHKGKQFYCPICICIQLNQLTSGVTEKCLLCGDDIPMERLARHLQLCDLEHSVHDDDDDFETVPTHTSSQPISLSRVQSTLP